MSDPLENGERIELAQLKAFARTLEGRTLETHAQRRPFTVQVLPRALVFTPLSTGNPRPVSDEQAAQFLDLFAERGAFEPVTCQREARNASYLLTLIRMYREL